ncbi:MAG TPA: EAL domain-containing protein [Solirubrobacteraceae bacterium]|nr:EAL domain-containing protein [Solirubrobacteraceae bacterium]
MKTLLEELSAGDAQLERVVRFANRHMHLDVVYVSQFKDGRQVYRAVAGDAASFNIVLDTEVPAQASFDRLMAEGEIPNVIPDVAADERVADLAVTRSAGIGSYVGVPVRSADGTLYGTLSCASHAPDHTLSDEHVRLLSLLGELIVYDVDEQRRSDELRGQIRRFTEARAFYSAYQPMFDLRSGRCLGVEALARFPEPFGRPDRAFEAADEVGLGLELELAAACRGTEVIPQLAPGQFVAVNVSPATLLHLSQRVRSGEAFPLSKLVVEVTEHSVVEAYEALRGELAPLREQGLRIAVDDVGAGYASLRHILELRPDFIKLDRWLIDGLADDRGRRVAVTAFVLLARELGSRVIAEGVEREADLVAVRELGLDAAQGFLLGRPSADAGDIAAWCADQPRPTHAAGAVRAPLGRELERLELDRRASQRLEAVGQLAAGIAHEINTPLQYVGDSVTFLRDAVDELVVLTGQYREALYTDAPIPLEERRRAMREAEDRADLPYLRERIPAAFERTEDGIARVCSIVQAMKRFSHTSTADAAAADINEAIETTLMVSRNEYKYVADVAVDLAEIPPVVCNIGELNQAFLNLIVNAAHAIEESVAGTSRRGRIHISTRLDHDHVVIAISDDGPGVPIALQERIYEPFFTTKQVGKGTGQGLALARATIERHSGSLECASAPGEGATFTIRVPLGPPATRSGEAA